MNISNLHNNTEVVNSGTSSAAEVTAIPVSASYIEQFGSPYYRIDHIIVVKDLMLAAKVLTASQLGSGHVDIDTIRKVRLIKGKPEFWFDDLYPVEKIAEQDFVPSNKAIHAIRNLVSMAKGL